MNISTVERTILEKCAKDAGWEIGSNAQLIESIYSVHFLRKMPV